MRTWIPIVLLAFSMLSFAILIGMKLFNNPNTDLFNLAGFAFFGASALSYFLMGGFNQKEGSDKKED